MNVLLLTSHSIAEFDDLRMLSDLGYDTFSIGAYSDPANPSDDKRPALPDVRPHPELVALCNAQREKHAGDDASFVIDWAKGDLHPDLLDWADVLIVHHFPIPWIVAQWPRLKSKRVIWRTCGQSDPQLERVMAGLKGLEIIRYSPAERRYFESVGSFAGEDALIRFGKYPADWGGWTGEEPVVGNVTQNMKQRGDACGYGFWKAATQGLKAYPAGPGSEEIGGVGSLSYDTMRAYLQSIRAYLYTGTKPASYTLGLIEAMMTGTPVLSIGRLAWDPGIADLFEGPEIAPLAFNPPLPAQITLASWLRDREQAAKYGERGRKTALELFGIEKVGRQWLDYLGSPATVTWQGAEAVA